MASLDSSQLSASLQRMLDELLDDATKTEICQAFAEYCDPYVPMDTGRLSESGLSGATPDGVVYNVPYATKQYVGVDIVHKLEHHPRATAFWDEVMMQECGEEFYQVVQDILLRRAKELYG